MAIATGIAVKEGVGVLDTKHIEYAIFKRPDLFPEIQRASSHFNLHEVFSPDSLSEEYGDGDLIFNTEKINWSKDLHESISIARQKAREKDAAEITPKFILYGILKNPNTSSHQSLINEDPCGKLRLTKFLEGYFWGVMFDEDEWIFKVSDLCHYGRYEEALQCCKKAIEIAPNDAFCLLQTTRCLREMKRFSEALEFAEKLLHMDPTNISFILEKIACLYYLGRARELLKIYNRLSIHNISNKKHIYYLYLWKIYALSTLQEYNEALKCVNKLLEIDPDNIEALQIKHTIMDYIDNR
jgi:tetratricopeptide (TPR) repeat protein